MRISSLNCSFLLVVALFLAPSAPRTFAGGHTNVAHYTFDNSGNMGADSSTNGYDMNFFGTGAGGTNEFSTDAISGGAVLFSTLGGYSFGVMGWDPMPSNLLSTVTGSFTLSVWVKTEQVWHSDGDTADFGAGIVTADVVGQANDLIPLSLTGSQAAFGTGGDTDDTLNSTLPINDGVYHQLVVTRNQTTGEKRLYIDGVLNVFNTATTNLLNAADFISIGAQSFATGNASSAVYQEGYDGLLDDLQIYSGVLSAGELMQIFNNPGTIVANTTNDVEALENAVDAANLAWTTGGDLSWISQTNVTHDGVDAAASGAISDNQISYIQTVMPTNGQLSFWWKVSSEEDFDFLVLYTNGDFADFITGEVDWNHQVWDVSAGDVIRWQYEKDVNSSDGSDRGWLDQVVFTPAGAGPPVSVNFSLQVWREQTPNSQDVYYAFPILASVSPNPVTTHVVVSPTGQFDSENGSFFQASLQQLIDECTNTNGWTLYINKDDPGERIFKFTAAVSGLTTNVLQAARLLSPTNGATNLPANSGFQWSGPATFSSLFVIAFSPLGNDGFTNLPTTATNWTPPFLYSGTNRFQITYTSNNATQFSFSTPVENGSTPISSWTTSNALVSYGNSIFVVTPPSSGTLLTNVQRSGGNLQFSVPTEAGRPYTIEGNTNISTTNWFFVTNFAGDGSLKQFTFPASNPPTQYFRVKTQ